MIRHRDVHVLKIAQFTPMAGTGRLQALGEIRRRNQPKSPLSRSHSASQALPSLSVISPFVLGQRSARGKSTYLSCRHVVSLLLSEALARDTFFRGKLKGTCPDQLFGRAFCEPFLGELMWPNSSPAQMRVSYRAVNTDGVQTFLGVEQLFISGLRMHAHFMDCTPKIAI